MAVKVIVPNKFFNGKRAGVKFVDGVGVFDNDKLGKEIAERFGYEVENVPKKAPAKKASPKKAPVKEEPVAKVEE